MATVDAAQMLDCLAASYRLDLDGPAYVRNMVEVATPLLDRGLGVMAHTYEVRDGSPPVMHCVALSERFDPSWLPPFYEAVDASASDGASPGLRTGFHAWVDLTCGQASAAPKMRPFLPVFAHIGGARDAFALNALDASGHGLWLGAPLPTTTRVPAAHVKLFARLTAHLTSGFRVRRSTGTSKPRPAAILSARGKMLHADNDNDDVVAARDVLRDAALAFESARTKKMRADVDGATERWRPLVVSRWSLLDDFDSDGRRFVVAIENSPPTRPPRKDLSEREHEVLTQAHMGHTNKVIAYELGLSHATVRVLLHRAARKLGASTRQEAIARFDALVKKHPRKDPTTG